MTEQTLSRRDFLQTSGAGVAGAMLLSACRVDGDTSEILAAAQAAVRPDFGVSVFEIPLSRVTLLDGPVQGDPLLGGQLDDLRIYSRALTASEVRTVFQSP